jgi:hypothetical protein
MPLILPQVSQRIPRDNSLYPHGGNWRDALTVRRGFELNYPLLTRQIEKHDGDLKDEHSFLGLRADNVVLTATKKVRQFIVFPSFCRMMLACGYCWLKMMRGLRDSWPKGCVSRRMRWTWRPRETTHFIKRR